MGLGFIDTYDVDKDTFSIQHVDFETLERVSYGEKEEKVIGVSTA